jgi:histone H3/H4
MEIENQQMQLDEQIVEAPVAEAINDHQVEGAGKKSGQKPARRTSDRAGLLMPVGRINRTMRKRTSAKNVSPVAAVYLTAALEAVVSEVLDGSWAIADGKKRKRIRPREIQEFLHRNPEYRNIFSYVYIADGGVEEHIDPSLLPKKKSKKATAEGGEEKKKGKKKPTRLEAAAAIKQKAKKAAPKKAKKAAAKKPAAKRAKKN